MKKVKGIRFITVFSMLLAPILYELVIGGGGHYMEIGPITARMLFFILALCLSVIYLVTKKQLKIDVAIIIIAFTSTLAIGCIVGYLNGAAISAILEDVKTLTFFYMLLFFSFTVRTLQDIVKVVKIIKIGSLILGIGFVLVVFLLLAGQINFTAFYVRQSQIGEIMFRNDTLFFYKGFVYLCIGFFFFLLSKGFWNKIGAFFLLFTIVLTLTRGFMLFTFLIFLFYVFFINRNVIYKWVIFVFSTICLLYAIPILLVQLGDKQDSDSLRYLQINEVLTGISPPSLFIGHGLGIGTESRPIHMELSFLEIFNKQGLIGLGFWLAIFFYIFFMYYNIRFKPYRDLALPFLLSVIFIILQSTTNPYMNNPIGLSMILITIVVFSKLLDLQRNRV